MKFKVKFKMDDDTEDMRFGVNSWKEFVLIYDEIVQNHGIEHVYVNGKLIGGMWPLDGDLWQAFTKRMPKSIINPSAEH